MADGNRYNGAMYGDWYMPAYVIPGYTRDPSEYPGYYNNLVVAPGYYSPYGPPYQVLGGKTEKSESSEKKEKTESAFKLDKNGHKGRSAQLAWPTERPTRLRVPIDCDACRSKLRSRLEGLSGVHDVGIEGWSSALVTVTGVAKPRDVLQVARSISPTSSVWDGSDSIDEFNAKGTYAKHH